MLPNLLQQRNNTRQNAFTDTPVIGEHLDAIDSFFCILITSQAVLLGHFNLL